MDLEEIAFLSRAQIDRRKTEAISSIDETLIRYAGVKTPQEISALTGIEPEDVVRRIHEVLNSVDILTVEQMRAKMLITLQGFVAEVDARKESAVDRNFAAMANAAGGNISRVMKELEDMERRTKMDIEAINQRRALELVRIVEKSMDRSLGQLYARYPELDKSEIQAIFRGHLLEVAREYEE